MATQKQINAAYNLLQKECGIKEGDKVRILRKFASNELGCNIDYVEGEFDMDACIGLEGIVEEVFTGHGSGIHVETDSGTWTWPFFVLEMLARPIMVELEGCDWNAFINDDGTMVSVGCQDIEAESILELADRIREIQDDAPIPKKKAKRK